MIGDVAELHIAAALIRSGRKVLRPLSSASRYDLLIDNEDGTFVRVQCKNGILRSGTIIFRVYSVSGHGHKTLPYGDSVDAFGVYASAIGATYLVPAAAISKHSSMVSL